VLHQAALHALEIGVGPVDLVDCDDNRHLRRARVVDRLDRLRHDAVVGGDDEDDEIGDFCAPRAHRGKRLMARRVEEGNAAAVDLNVVRADMLCDAAGLAFRHVRAADRVEKRGFAVVDVAHDRNDGRPRLERRLGLFDLVLDLELGFRVERDVLDLMIELGRDQCRGVGVEHLVDGGHHAHLHELLDDIARLDAHVAREVADADYFRDADYALARLGNRDLGLLLLFAGQGALLFREAARAHIALAQLEHVLLFDDAFFMFARLGGFTRRGPVPCRRGPRFARRHGSAGTRYRRARARRRGRAAERRARRDGPRDLL
jgi:hypothetical protein